MDTGRLFPETYDVWSATEDRYGKKLKPFYPNQSSLEKFVSQNGINGFYNSRIIRKNCCHIRKVEPLNRALSCADIWITGLRAEQSSGRAKLTFSEVDDVRSLLKVNPIIDWSQSQLEAFIDANDIPVNALHQTGYPSIGCQPCTRAVSEGEDERAGRWWWENEDVEADQECGLHVGPNGRLVRNMDDNKGRQNA